MILIVGSTGTTGRDVVARLVEQGVQVRAMTRDLEKARQLPKLAGASVVFGDPAQPETLAAAFVGVDKVLLIPPSGADWNKSEQNLIEAARRANVQYVVKLSVMGADHGAPSHTLSYHKQGEEKLAASGIPFTILRANSFMQNFLVYYGATIRSDGAVYQCIGDAKLAMIDTRDVAEIAAKILTAPIAEHQGQIYELTGAASLNYSDAVQKIGEATGRTVRYVHLPLDVYEQALLSANLPPAVASEVVNVYGRGYYHDGQAAQMTPTAAHILGRTPRSFDDFVRDHKSEFLP